jgi:hypothetical protein
MTCEIFMDFIPDLVISAPQFKSLKMFHIEIIHPNILSTQLHISNARVHISVSSNGNYKTGS